MVEVKKSKWTQFRFMQKYQVTQQFQKLYVKSSYMPSEAIFLVSHSGWWDPIILCELERRHEIPPLYMMMHAELLRQYPSFEKNGAFSVDLENNEESLKGFQYADLLLSQGHSVAVFPQRQFLHQDVRPLNISPTLDVLTTLCRDIPIVPVTVYYAQRNTKKGEAWVVLGEPLYADVMSMKDYTSDVLEEVLTQQLDQLRVQVLRNDTTGFNNVL